MKKKLIVLNTTILLGLGTFVSIPSVNAESINDLEKQQHTIQGERTGIQSEIDTAVAKISKLQDEQVQLTAQIKRIDQAIKDNQAKITETKSDIEETNQEITQLDKDIAELKERIQKRNEILKERAIAFQKSGGDVNYLEVLLGSSNFGDLLSRVGAVATMVDADRTILEEHEADKKELEEKQAAVEKKLADLTNMKTELEGMLAQINDQKDQSIELSKNLAAKETAAAAIISDLKEKDADLAAQVTSIQQDMVKEKVRIAEAEAAKQRAAEKAEAKHIAAQEQKQTAASTKTTVSVKTEKAEPTNKSSSPTEKAVSKKSSTTEKTEAPSAAPAPAPVAPVRNLSAAVTAGNKYIGNSVYVFGGGRTQSDINNGRFDCSAFVRWAYSQAGINVGSMGAISTDTLKGYGTKISASQMQPGDMVFFNTYKTDGHVGIYVGGGKFIGSQSSTGVAIASMTSGYWKGVFTGHVRRL
ncbi:C40 family peptidase [Peribacillus psychrosaccharolyticus]|uniref:C40 family peptidase n=1 Tax=Peribacillus psychrosaccharolyticus TaxID=1407 RepID=A0A974NPV6_PERPY|nr:C40 family peptidase [Peribacillus psychrosaccharolyticus]MEC2057779.1 NlpC/P60 family protein [Peribacillus psychrosaccharolyticus]MED3746305.1 NlpC/P60 family protein [Peribacillus psychrosaccharolyticus]QQT01896.1 C40 family peptidase [Peribacillus psychrosaccharolyticus]